MKLTITVGGVEVPNYTDAAITYDAKYSSSATFTTRQATNGAGWYSNLSKILINGRELKAESGAWGFEESKDCYDWSVRHGATVTALTPAAQDIHESAYGQASLQVSLAAAQTYDLFHTEWQMNMNGLSFWAWFHISGGSAFITPYAVMGSSRWEGARVTAVVSPQWVAAGMRVMATQIQPNVPYAIDEWGFTIENTGAAGTLHMDSVNLCGHAYPAGVQAPPFAACSSTLTHGSLQCFTGHPCGNWDAHNWADDAHIVSTDAGWCATVGAWDSFIWADERVPSSNDYQWI